MPISFVIHFGNIPYAGQQNKNEFTEKGEKSMEKEYTEITIEVTGRLTVRVPKTNDPDALFSAAQEKWMDTDFGPLENIEYAKMVTEDGETLYEA